MKNIEILVVNDDERENLFAEIWINNKIICEITNENKLEITFYNLDDVKFDYSDFMLLIE